MQYLSSKGAVEIDTMPLPYAKNALAKLLKGEPHRAAEIGAIQAHVEKLSAEAGNDDDANPRVVIGNNNPPEELPVPKLEGRSAIDTHVGDLLTEAANWGDGTAVANQGQADSVGRLHRMLQQAVGIVDDAATEEKRPLNEAIGKIADWQNGYTAKGLKTKPDGKLTKALAATGNLSAAWLRKEDDARKAREAVVAEAARKAALEAVALREEAKESTDIAVMDRAEDALDEARSLLRGAEAVSKERVSVGGGGGFRALTLRTVWRAEIASEKGWALAYGHYKQDPEFMTEFHALIQRWADRDVRTEATRVRGVPGFNFIADKVV